MISLLKAMYLLYNELMFIIPPAVSVAKKKRCILNCKKKKNLTSRRIINKEDVKMMSKSAIKSGE